MPSSLQLELLALPGLDSFVLLGLADYLQLALITVSFHALYFPTCLYFPVSCPQHISLDPHLFLRPFHQSQQQRQRVILSLQPVVLELLPVGVSG